MGEWLKDKLDKFEDFEFEFIEETEKNKGLNLPPVIKGRSLVDNPNKKTILIYNHYDVMPVSYFRSNYSYRHVLIFECSRPTKRNNGIL